MKIIYFHLLFNENDYSKSCEQSTCMNSEKLEKDFVSSKVIGKHRSPFVIVSERAFCDLRRGKSETMLFVRLFKIGDLRKANTSFVK